MKLTGSDLADSPENGERIFRISPWPPLAFSVVCVYMVAVGAGQLMGVIGHSEAGFWAATVFAGLSLGLVYLAWLCGSQAVDALRTSNWLIKSSVDGLKVKFRCFKHHYLSDKDEVVVCLNWSEIDALYHSREVAIKSVGEGPETVYRHFLDIRLRLSEHELKRIQKALGKEQSRLENLPSRLSKSGQRLVAELDAGLPEFDIKQQYSAGSKSSRNGLIKNQYCPVALKEVNLLRVPWNSIRPSLMVALSEFCRWAEIEPEECFKTDSSQPPGDQAQDQLIFNRINAGQLADAIELVSQRYGYCSDDARKIVEELSVKRSGYA
ncbi:MAG: hypothetical protein JKY89_08525 [Immundisolibacteraceae bacterium]|nr:hypothetical protein [Immundisolibacteraceae bacterium]